MASKGGASWRGGARPRPSGSMQQPRAEAQPVLSKGRKLVSDKRVTGCINEWSNNFGWIVPLQKINHPQARKSNGRIYLHRNDLRNGKPLAVGSNVDFFLYLDGRGLGAGDCREVQPGSTEASAALHEETNDDFGGESLPEGWEKVWSAEHNEFYFWHRQTKESSWTRPALAEEAAENEDEAPLPEGWEKHFDPEHNEWYYWHRPTKTTTWERPSPEPNQEEDEQHVKEPENEVRPAAEGPVLGQQRIQGQVISWNGFFGWIKPEGDVPEDVKPLLEQHSDKIYVNWRDVETGATLKVGSAVDFLFYADDNGLGASDCRLYQPAADQAPQKRGVKRGATRDTMAELENQWKQQDAELAAVEGEAAEEMAAAEPSDNAAETFPNSMDAADESPLLPGWEQQWSNEHQCHYYWHKATKQSSWERPAVLLDTGTNGEASREKIWEGEGAEEGAAKMATPLTPLESQEGKEMTPITPGGTRARNAPAINGNVANDASKFLRPQAKARGMTPAQPQQVPPHLRQQNRPAAPQQRWGSTPYQGGKIPAWSQVKKARVY